MDKNKSNDISLQKWKKKKRRKKKMRNKIRLTTTLNWCPKDLSLSLIFISLSFSSCSLWLISLSARFSLSRVTWISFLQEFIKHKKSDTHDPSMEMEGWDAWTKTVQKMTFIKIHRTQLVKTLSYLQNVAQTNYMKTWPIW